MDGALVATQLSQRCIAGLKEIGGQQVFNLGKLSFDEGRSIQEHFHAMRRAGECRDLILLCEHPPTLSIGKRGRETDLGISVQSWKGRGVEVVKVARGGGVTYHGPGQLLVYPVVSLKDRQIGVRSFVAQGLQLISDVFTSLGLPNRVELERPGVWISGRKIASVGLQIVQGVSLHGWSINLDCELSPFSLFNACGIENCEVTSLNRELAPKSLESDEFIDEFSLRLGRWL